MADDNVKIGIQVDTEQFDKAIKDVLGKIKTLKEATQNSVGDGIKNQTKDVGGLAQSWKQVAAGVFTGTAAYNALMEVGRKVIEFSKQSIKLAVEEEVDQKKLFNALEKNTDAYIRMEEFKSKMMKGTTFTKDEIEGAINMALELGRTEEQTQKMITAAEGLSKVTGKDLNASMMMLSATFEGQIGRLGRYAGEVKKLTQEQLRNGDAIDIINKRFGKFATEGLDSAAGAADQFGKSMEELQISIGEKFVNGISKTYKALTGFIDTLTEWFKVPMSEKLTQESEDINNLVLSITSLNESNEVRTELLNKLILTYPQYFGNLDADKVSNKELLLILQDVNVSLEERIRLMAISEEKVKAEATAVEAFNKRLETLNKISDAYKRLGGDITKVTTAQEKLNFIASKGKQGELVDIGLLFEINPEKYAERLRKELELRENSVTYSNFKLKKIEESLQVEKSEREKRLDKINLDFSLTTSKQKKETYIKQVEDTLKEIETLQIEYRKKGISNDITAQLEKDRQLYNAAVTNLKKQVSNVGKTPAEIEKEVKAEEARLSKINDIKQKWAENAGKIYKENLTLKQQIDQDEIEAEILKIDKLVKEQQIGSDEAIALYKKQYDKKKEYIKKEQADEEAFIQAQLLQIQLFTKAQGFVDPESKARIEQLEIQLKAIRQKYSKQMVQIDNEQSEKSTNILQKEKTDKEIILKNFFEGLYYKIENVPQIILGIKIDPKSNLELKTFFDNLSNETKEAIKSGTITDLVNLDPNQLSKLAEYTRKAKEISSKAAKDISNDITDTFKGMNIKQIFQQIETFDPLKNFSLFDTNKLDKYKLNFVKSSNDIIDYLNSFKNKINIIKSDINTDINNVQVDKNGTFFKGLSEVEKQQYLAGFEAYKKALDELDERRKKDNLSEAQYVAEKQEIINKNFGTITQSLDDSLVQIDNKIVSVKQKAINYQKEIENILITGMINLISQGLNTAIDMQLRALQTATENALNSLNEVYENNTENLNNLLKKNLITQEQYDKKKEQLDKEKARKEADLKRRQAEKEKELALMRIIINTAVSVMQGYAQGGPILGSVLALLAIAAGAIEYAAVESEPIPEFKKGGKVPEGMVDGPSHENGGVKMNTPNGPVELEGGEYIVNKESVKKKGVKEILDKINSTSYLVNNEYITKFERGGLISNLNNRYTIPDSKSITTTKENTIINNYTTTNEPLNMEELKSAIVKSIIEIPVTVVESDITKTQRKVSVIESKSKW